MTCTTLPINMRQVYRPFLRHFRKSRIQKLYDLFPIDASTEILDVGGTPFIWELAREMGFPVPHLTLLNIDDPAADLPNYITWRVADARKMPFKNSEFDVVFSNSVIEHLSNWSSQQDFADEIRRVGKNYFVQTPDRSFPVEPHLLTPLIHWLPRSAQRKLLRNCTVWGIISRPSARQCDRFMDEICLLNQDEMGKLFPDSNLIAERWLGLSKSIIAVRKVCE